MIAELIILPGGVLFIHDDEVALALSAEGDTIETRRASNVEPDPEHPGMWTAQLLLGDHERLGPFPTRREALAAEIEALKRILSEPF